MDYNIFEKQLKILADKTRLQILHLIHQGDLCGCELIQNLEVSQPTLSHHLKVLNDAGFIIGKKDKNRINYQVNMDKLNEITVLLNTMFHQKNIDC